LVIAVAGCGVSQGDASTAPPGQLSPQPTSEQSTPPTGEPTPKASEDSGEASAASAPSADLPAPGAVIPKDPAELARTLSTATTQLRRAIDDWTQGEDAAKANPPEPVVLLALHQQRIYRYLARNPEVASRTYAKMPKALAGEAKENVTAIRELLSLARPISGKVKFRVQPPEPADVLLRHFRRVERRFGVEWEVLASVMFVETKFGRVRSPSYTGARGPMQFMPGTWDAYGMGGDINDTQDALLAAGNYLHASGAPGNYRRALYAYNHSYAYVNAVLRHARQMKRDVRNYYAYYNWQVFVLTTRGERRLTGP
jgi:hypothetical protein